MAFVDPLGLLLVGGGSALIAALRATGEDIARAAAALRPLVTADPVKDGHAARAAVGRIQRLAEIRSLACADRVETAQPFLRQAARALANAGSAADFARWGEAELESRAERHAAAADVWRAVADAAPAMGLAGTVIGLIGMFAAMDDPARVGPGMALALTTTLYGVLLANLIAAPIAARLDRLSAAERAWQRRTVDALARLATAELSPPATVVELPVRYERAA